MNGFIQESFRFDLVAAGATSRWIVHCQFPGDEPFPGSAAVADLDLRRDEGTWELSPRLPLQLRTSAFWAHNGQPVRRSVPAWMQREAVAQLAVWALARARKEEEGAAS